LTMKKIKYFNVFLTESGETRMALIPRDSLYRAFLQSEYYAKHGWRTLYRVKVIYKPKKHFIFEYLRNIILKLSPCIRYR